MVVGRREYGVTRSVYSETDHSLQHRLCSFLGSAPAGSLLLRRRYLKSGERCSTVDFLRRPVMSHGTGCGAPVMDLSGRRHNGTQTASEGSVVSRRGVLSGDVWSGKWSRKTE